MSIYYAGGSETGLVGKAFASTHDGWSIVHDDPYEDMPSWDDVLDGEAFWYLKHDETTGIRKVEIGLKGDNRIRIDDSGIFGWHEGSGVWMSLYTNNVNIVNDKSPQLGGDLDLNGFNIDFPTTADISDCIDDDTMATASDDSLATSESIKAYIDNTVKGGLGFKGNTIFHHDIDSVITNITTRTTSLHNIASIGNPGWGWYVANGTTTTDLVSLGGSGEITLPDLIGVGAGNNRFLRGNSTQGLTTATGGQANPYLRTHYHSEEGCVKNDNRCNDESWTTVYDDPYQNTGSTGDGTGTSGENQPPYKDALILIKLI